MNRSPYLPGDTVAGKYRLDREVGRGGMGFVYVATRVTDGEAVAIKLLRAGFETGDTAERFRREARAASRIRNEHVVRVLDFGEHERIPYLVMEYLDGRDLDEELRRRGPLMVSHAVHYILEACEALASVHVQGVIHRDIKPANLFLSQQPDGVVLKVLDFGISKDTGVVSVALTNTHSYIGSPQYMAPEQLQRAKEIDAGVDIWAVGVTLFELLAGEGPFAVGTTPAICTAILREDPPDLRVRRPDVPDELQQVIRRCLAKARTDRFATVADLAIALRPFGRPAKADMSIERIVGTYRQAGSLVATAHEDPVDEIEQAIARLGGYRAVPTVAMTFTELELGGHDLDHRVGFILSCVDGRSTVEELIDISGMTPLETVRLLCRLLDSGVLALRA